MPGIHPVSEYQKSGSLGFLVVGIIFHATAIPGDQVIGRFLMIGRIFSKVEGKWPGLGKKLGIEHY
jgi:hypothetical protein